ncbi:hypothetical protein AB0O58_21060 [Rhodococcus sp. NPDC080181]|uniref:hypothetical protein n=1 Tax=Rhodococcus sp. NPDC080181 TaxID=3155292 RepID=UPI00344EEBD7
MKEFWASLQVAAAFGLFLLFEPVLDDVLADHGNLGLILKYVIGIGVTSAVIHVASGRFLERPTLEVDWVYQRTETAGPMVQLDYPASNLGRIRVYELKVKFAGTSQLARRMQQWCLKKGAVVKVRFDPDQTAMFVQEMSGSSQSGARVASPREVHFEIYMFPVGAEASWLEISIEAYPGSSSVAYPQCGYSVEVNGIPGWLASFLMPISSPVKQFQLRRV